MRMAMVAGEASGDLLAGLLMGGLRRQWPALESFGIGGPHMRAQGFQAWWPHEKLAVRGYIEVLKHYREIKNIRDQLARRLLLEPPQVFVGIDAPDFNLGLERQLKAQRIPTIHFVCPSIWAWRGGRAKNLARSADLVLCLFPFEPELLQAHGMRAAYVGHPLADAIPLVPPRAAARERLGLSTDGDVVALLPGSRRSEIEYIAQPILEAALLMQQQRPALHFVLPVAPGLQALMQGRIPAGLNVKLLDGQSHDALAACDITLIASGTATLEAALFKRPMVIAYRMHALTWALMKRMAYQPWVGLPNILCKEFVVPELIQERCTPPALAEAALQSLDDAAGRDRLVSRFTELHHTLRRDTARCATDAIAQSLGQ